MSTQLISKDVVEALNVKFPEISSFEKRVLHLLTFYDKYSRGKKIKYLTLEEENLLSITVSRKEKKALEDAKQKTVR